MDPSRLDALAKVLATTAPRRLLVRRLAGGGALLGAFGFGRSRVAAQDAPATGAIQQCTGVFRARTQDPVSGSPLDLDGDLTIEIGPSGSVDGGTLVDRALGSIPVRGTVSGRRISLLFSLDGDSRRLAAGGTAENDVLQCLGGMYGTFAVAPKSDDPQPGDVGSWTFVA